MYAGKITIFEQRLKHETERQRVRILSADRKDHPKYGPGWEVSYEPVRWDVRRQRYVWDCHKAQWGVAFIPDNPGTKPYGTLEVA